MLKRKDNCKCKTINDDIFVNKSITCFISFLILHWTYTVGFGKDLWYTFFNLWNKRNTNPWEHENPLPKSWMTNINAESLLSLPVPSSNNDFQFLYSAGDRQIILTGSLYSPNYSNYSSWGGKEKKSSVSSVLYRYQPSKL